MLDVASGTIDPGSWNGVLALGQLLVQSWGGPGNNQMKQNNPFSIKKALRNKMNQYPPLQHCLRIACVWLGAKLRCDAKIPLRFPALLLRTKADFSGSFD